MKTPSLVYGVLLLAAVALLSFLVFDYREHQRQREEQSIHLGSEAGRRVALALDAELSAVAQRARDFAAQLVDVENEQHLLQAVERESHALPLLLGVTVAFEPGRFVGKERYAPFFNRSADRFQFVEESYDYTDHSLKTARWYTDVLAAGGARWSEPYYAKAAQTMVVDYGVPLVNGAGELVGVVDYAIALSDFARIVDALSVGEAGYGFTYDASGAILSHPDPELLLHNVFQLRDGKDEAIVASLRDDSEGIVAYESTYTYEHSWFFFRQLESTGWKSVLVFTADDLLGASDEGRRKIIRISVGLSTALFCLILFLLGIGGYNERKLWLLAASFSLLVVGNTACIWYLNLREDISVFDAGQERIVNDTILDNQTAALDANLDKLVGTPYTHVPTGVFVESYELRAFEASVIGKIWMKYPKALYESTPPDFYFPNISALEARARVSEKVSEQEFEDHVLVTWKFRATLEQDLSYLQYPFEQMELQVVLMFPDFSKHVLLVPDLESYDILDPSVKPGISAGMRTPTSNTIASYFTIKPISYKTSFGYNESIQSHPALQFHIVAKRIWLSPFIANIIPVFIVALILFIVLFVSSSDEDEGKTGLTTMNVVQSAAGLLFILLLAHVNERNRIETPEIAYIELFYFTMYVAITLQTIILAMFFRGTHRQLLGSQLHLGMKLLFWPALVWVWFALTLWRFY